MLVGALVLAACGGSPAAEPVASEPLRPPPADTVPPPPEPESPASEPEAPPADTVVLAPEPESPAPEPESPPAASEDLPAEPLAFHVDGDTVWQDVFDALTAAEQTCISGELDDDLLSSVLERQVLAGTGSERWEPSIFACLDPDTARALFLAALIESFAEELDVGDFSDEELTCLREWVTDIDVAALVAADDAEFVASVTSVMGCLARPFLTVMFAEMGVDMEDLSEDELSCLQQWLSDLGMAAPTDSGYSAAVFDEVLSGLMGCVPDVYLGAVLAELGVDMRDLGGDEMECLRQWMAAIDLEELLTVEVDDDAAFAESGLSLERCIPDVFLAAVLADMGVDMRDLSGEERECLRQSVAHIDLEEMATAMARFDAAIEGFGLPLARCVPDVFLDAMLAEIGLNVADLSGDDMECLRRWLAAIDLDQVGTVLTDTELAVSIFESDLGVCVIELLLRARR